MRTRDVETAGSMNVPDTPSSPLVWTVLVNWNGWQDTLACLESLDSLDYPANHVVVVDNASTDDSVERLREARPDLHVITSAENLGFAGGCNRGITAALEAGADYVWLLNNDTIVESGTLAPLVEACKTDATVAAAGSKIYYFDRPNVIWHAGGELLRTGHTHHFGADETDVGQYDTPRDVDYVTGCSMLVRTGVVRDIGPMREEYFLYWEETDWAARMIENGMRVRYVPASRLWHKVNASSPSEDGTERMLAYMTRNMLTFHRLHYPRRLPGVLLGALRQAASFRIAGYPRRSRAVLAGVAAFARRREGRIA